MEIKERLEEIEQSWNESCGDVRLLDPEDVDWFINTTKEQQKEIEHLKDYSQKSANVALLAELENENSRLQNEWIKCQEQIGHLEAAVHDLRGENTRLGEALEFYADERNYEVTGEKTYIGHGDFTEETWIEVNKDQGEKARQVLKKLKEKP